MWQCNQMPATTVSYHFHVTMWACAHILRRCYVIISCSQSDTGRLGWLSKILPRHVHQNLSYLIYKNITLNRPLNNHLLADLYRDSPTEEIIMRKILPRPLIITLRPWQDGHHFPDDIFKCIFLSENVWISLRTSLKFVLRCELTIFQHWFR